MIQLFCPRKYKNINVEKRPESEIHIMEALKFKVWLYKWFKKKTSEKTVSPVDWTVAGQAAHSTQRRIKLNLWAAIFSRHTSANLKRNIKNPLRCILPDAFLLLVRLDWASWSYFIRYYLFKFCLPHVWFFFQSWMTRLQNHISFECNRKCKNWQWSD